MICKDKYESERFVLSHTTDAVLMGGYLRDLFFQRPWKDIDLFYSVTSDAVKAYSTGGMFHLYWWDASGELIYTKWKTVSRAEYESDFCVMESEQLPGVQLILFSKGYDKLKTQYEMCLSYMHYDFPCNLSRAALSLETTPRLRTPHYTYSFEQGVEKGVLEFSTDCSQEYRDRMVEYFPDFKVMLGSPYFFGSPYF